MILPYYAPIKGYDYDQSRVIEELNLNVKKESGTDPIFRFKNGRSIVDQDKILNFASDEELQNTKHAVETENGLIHKEGKYETFKLYSLTYIPEEPLSKLGHTFDPDNKQNGMFFYRYRHNWTWQEEYLNSYTRQVVESLPWEYVQLVRLIVMWPNSIGQTHADGKQGPLLRYYEQGHATITFNVSTGGGQLYYVDCDGESKVCDNTEKIWHFDDSCVHGVSRIIDEPRYQLRVWGKLKVPYESLFK